MAKNEIVVRSIGCDEEGKPEHVILALPIEILARVSRVVGKLSPDTTDPPEDSWACNEFYQAVTGNVFNRWWDGGLEDYFA